MPATAATATGRRAVSARNETKSPGTSENERLRLSSSARSEVECS